MALLTMYYEHGPEHTPPRDPTGAMQRRERGYTAPPNPLPLLKQKLTADDRDRALKDWVGKYETALRKNELRSSQDPTELHPQGADFIRSARATNGGERSELFIAPGPALPAALANCSLDSTTLLDVGRAMQFLNGDEFAVPWYRAGMLKAADELKDAKPGEERVRTFLALSEQVGKALWRTNTGWDVQEQRFRLAHRLYPPLSPDARRNGVLLGVSFFYQGKSKDAAVAIVEVQKEHDQAGDLGALEKSDFDEMSWLSGLFLSQAGRYDEAKPHWERCAKLGGHWAQTASTMLAQFDQMKAQRTEREREIRARTSPGGE